MVNKQFTREAHPPDTNTRPLVRLSRPLFRKPEKMLIALIQTLLNKHKIPGSQASSRAKFHETRLITALLITDKFPL
jgi:hypothetical protein